MAQIKRACHFIFGHAFFSLQIFMETQETIIYVLVMRNLSYDAYFWFFVPLFAGNGRGHWPDQKLAHWVDLLVKPLSQNHVFEISGEKPLPLNVKDHKDNGFIWIWYFSELRHQKIFRIWCTGISIDVSIFRQVVIKSDQHAYVYQIHLKMDLNTFDRRVYFVIIVW